MCTIICYLSDFRKFFDGGDAEGVGSLDSFAMLFLSASSMESDVRLCKRSVPRLGVGTSSRVVMIISTTRARDATKSRAAKMELSYNRFSQPPHNCNNKNVVLVFSYVKKKRLGSYPYLY